MEMRDIISEIKLELTGGILELELEDAQIEQAVNKCLRELERYWDETKLITVPFASCIDLSGLEDKIVSVSRIYRTDGYGNTSDTGMGDPLYMQQWMIFSNGGTMYNLNDYVLNYASWSSLMQIKNTISTDMSFKEDKHGHKLYINNYMATPKNVTIEYIPKLRSVEDIQDEYWLDILIRLSLATVKVILGRIRTRFNQSNALWTQDGEKMLEEGGTELNELREVLRTNSNMIYPID